MSKILITEDVLQNIEDDDIRKEYSQLLEKSPIARKIPPFFFERSKKHLTVHSLIMDWAKSNSLYNLKKKYPSIEEIEQLRETLKNKSAGRFPSLSTSRSSYKSLKYSQYCQLRENWPNYQEFLSSKLFLDLCSPNNNTVSEEDLFKHLMIQSCSLDYFTRLVFFDKKNKGILRKKHFSLFMRETVDRYEFIDDLNENKENGEIRYIIFVTERFYAALDPLQTGCISIDKIISSDLFLELIKLDVYYNENIPNAFSEAQAQSYIDQFDRMDGDHDGILTKDDLLHMPETRFTQSFVDQLFDKMTLTGKFDFSWFCRFRYTYNNIGRQWANLIIFDIIDIDKNNEINETEFNYFYHDISRDYEDYFERDAPYFKDFINELLDICSATNSVITKEQFVNSTETPKLVKHLVDLRALAKWERNETIPERGEE